MDLLRDSAEMALVTRQLAWRAKAAHLSFAASSARSSSSSASSSSSFGSISSIGICGIAWCLKARCKAARAARAASREASEAHYFPQAVHSKADDSLDEDDEHLAEEICELIGYDLGESLSSEISEPFSEEELEKAYEASGFYSAQRAKKKAAVWLIGPSACGKSTLAPKAATWTGINTEGYVTIDGEAFRDAHQGYQKAIMEGHQNGCVWWGAYLGIRENINEDAKPNV